MLQRLGLAAVVALVAVGSVRGQWTAVEEAGLVPGDLTAFDELGTSVSIDGKTAVIGAPLAVRGTVGKFENVEGLAFDSGSSTLYGSDVQGDQLLTIDMATGAGTPVGFFGFSLAARVWGLAFDPAPDVLYGSKSILQGPVVLVKIDPATGAGTEIGATGFDGVRGLAFDPNARTLYGSDTTLDQLIVIDTATGAGTAVGTLGYDDVQGLAFDPGTNTLFGSDAATGQWLAIDTATGAGTAIGTVGFGDIHGLTFDAGTSTALGTDTIVDELVAINTTSGLGMSLGHLTGGPLVLSGSAYVFVRTGTIWSEQAKLFSHKWSPGDLVGTSTAVSGDTIVVGAPGQYPAAAAGAASVFTRNGTVWTEQAQLEANNALAGDGFGSAVAISGNTVVVGAPYFSSQTPWEGAAYVYVRRGTQWTQQARLRPGFIVEGDTFGRSVAIDADTVLVGAPGRDSPWWPGFESHGEAYVFVRDGSSWHMEATLQRKTAPTEDNEEIGAAVAIDGNTAVVGGPAGSPFTPGTPGSAYIYVRTGSQWNQQRKLKASDGTNRDKFGRSVAISGDFVFVGAPWWADVGAAYVYRRIGTKWSELTKLADPNPGAYDEWGGAVGISGGYVVIGAPYDDTSAGTNSGSGFAYRVAAAPMTYCTAGTSASACRASLSTVGTASASAASGFDLTASAVEGGRAGLYFFGSNGRQANPWGNGTSYQCVVPPVSRGGILQGTGTPGQCDGMFSQDLNARWTAKPNQNPGAGATVQAQLWYRDPFNTSNQTTSLSDAIEFVMAP